MKYLITIEVTDAEYAMGDSPPLKDTAAWERYLDIAEARTFMRVVKVEVA